MVDNPPLITGGVDTHADTHTVAALNSVGQLLGHATFPAGAAGYRALLALAGRARAGAPDRG